MSKQPNVLFILSDQHNAKILGHKDHPDAITPNLDQMAAQGVRFDNAITQNPICTPSRVSWISGQYCHNHGYYSLSGPNPNGLPTVFGHFKNYGYTTAAIGKIHCPESWVEDDCDVFHETCTCSIGGRSHAYSVFLKKRGKLELEDHGGMPEFGARGRQSMEGRPSPLTFDESQEGWIADTAIDFMKNAKSEDKPFFVHASLPRPHQCTSPSQEFWDMYEGKELTLPENADYEMEGKSPAMINSANSWRKRDWALIEPKTFEAARLRKLRGYLAAVTQVDHAVGQMVKFLEESGLDENTIVVYSADHGDYACEHGIMEKAPGIGSDAITRIPYIWKWAGKFKPGHVANEIVEAVDMTQTVCSLTGVPLMETSDGRDLTPLLNGETKEIHSLGVTEFPWSHSIRKDNYRFVYYPQEKFSDEYPKGFYELYDLDKDPWEMNNLFFQEEYKDLIHQFEKEFLDWLITTTRPTTIHPPVQNDSEQGTTRYKHTVNADGKTHYDNIRKQNKANNGNYI